VVTFFQTRFRLHLQFRFFIIIFGWRTQLQFPYSPKPCPLYGIFKNPLIMARYLFWTLLLFSCHSNSDADSHGRIHSQSDTVRTSTPETKINESRISVKQFDNRRPFEIVSVTSTLNKHTTDTDTSKCSRWTLTKPDIEKIIKNSVPIDGTTWDLSFLVLACTKSISVVQSGQQFNVELNAASFFSVNNGDTTVLFGDYKKSDRKYFIYGPDRN
jgi:hypothetical protein